MVDGVCCGCRYYADIRQTISASDQEMNSALAELSRVSADAAAMWMKIHGPVLTVLFVLSELLWRAQLPGGAARALQVHQQILRSGAFTPSGREACLVYFFVKYYSPECKFLHAWIRRILILYSRIGVYKVEEMDSS